MTKLLLPYNKTILKANIIFSVFLTMLSSLIFLAEPPKHSVVWLLIFIYTLCLMTGGFLLSAYYFEMTRRNEYYFYYNLGMGKIQLLIYTYALHLIFIIPFIIILKYV